MKRITKLVFNISKLNENLIEIIFHNKILIVTVSKLKLLNPYVLLKMESYFSQL